MTGWRTWTAAVVGLVLVGGVAGPSWVSAQPTERHAQALTVTEAPAGDAKGPNTGRVASLWAPTGPPPTTSAALPTCRTGAATSSPMPRSASSCSTTSGRSARSPWPRGIWNNFHYGAGKLVEPSDPRFWFESDLYLKLSATWWDTLTTGVTYTYYTSPNDSFSTYADVGLSFSLNDAPWLGAFALNPSLLVAFETKGEALLSDNFQQGIYMAFGLAPSYTVFEDASLSLTVSAPLRFGFSLKDYYTVNSKNQTFGYFSGGPLFTWGLKFIPAAFGNWALKAGVQVLVLNTNLKAVNTGEGVVPIGNVGVVMTY